MSEWRLYAVIAAGFLATLSLMVGGYALLDKSVPDPFAQYGAPAEVFAHDQVVFADGSIYSVQDMFAGIDGDDWPDFARRVVKSGGRFERVECEVWKLDTRTELHRCVPGRIAWHDAVAYDFAMEA